MRVLLIGGTGFTGPPLVQELLQRGHEVTLLHRGQTTDPRTEGARQITGDRREEGVLERAIRECSPEVVVDMIPFTPGDAASTLQACGSLEPRIVALSSIDVYMAYGRIHRSEPGPIQETPLTEESMLRETDQPEGPTRDKVGMEKAYRSGQLPTTILRLPAIYGERDHHRRFRTYFKRMEDGREHILLGETIAGWRFSRGYVENVAHAITLAVEQGDDRSDVFNVAEPTALTELEFVRAIGQAVEWKGEVNVLPDKQLPKHLQVSVDFRQDWVVDSGKLRTRFGYSEKVEIREAYERTVAWERENPPESEPVVVDYEREDEALRRS